MSDAYENDDDLQVRSNAGGRTYAALHGGEALTFDSLDLACEHSAMLAWRAVCNGKGRVDPVARKTFDRARKAYASADRSGSIVDYIAQDMVRVVRRLVRQGKRGIVTMHVDGVQYGACEVVEDA